MLESFLAKLGASTRITVGVSISPAVGLEMIEVDRATGTVKKYSCRPLDYDHSTREITDFNQFQIGLEELFDELHIPKRSNILLSIPNVHFGMINLPLLLTDDGVTNAIVSEVEQSYIFKRKEPVVGWAEVYSNVDTENRTLVYTAVQKHVLDAIIEVCNEVGCTLVGVENSYTSLLRALYYTDIAKDQMQDNITWNLMVIGQNSYSIISMVGKKVMEYYEEPLALKSFVDDEIYNAITSSAQLTLTGLYANYLFIVSETDLVSAEVLSMKISSDSTIKFLECNKYVQNEILPTSLDILPKLSMQISPEAVGTTISPFCDFPLKLNLVKEIEGSLDAVSGEAPVPKVNIGGLEVELTPSFVKRLALISAAIFVLPVVILYFLLANLIVPKEQASLDEVTNQVTQVNASLAEYTNTAQDNTFNLNTTMSDISAGNKSQVLYYVSLGVGIPNRLWMTYYSSNDDGKVDIRGRSSNVESIYTFYKNIKQLVNNSDIKLYKLEIASDSIDDIVRSSFAPKYYEFEITNMTEAELNPPAVPADGKTPGAGPQDAAATSEAPFGFQLNKRSPVQNTNPSAPQQQPGLLPGISPPSPSPIPPAAAPVPSGGENLPKNLQKIEKF